MWAASLRLALATVLLAGIALLLRHPFPRGAALRAALGYGLLQFGLNFSLLYWGETRFPSGLTAVLYATIPLSTALMTAATGLERLTRVTLAGAVVALAGVALLFRDQAAGEVGALPALALLTAATLAAWSGLILKRGPRQSPVWSTAVGSAAGLAVCLAVSFAAGEAHPFPSRFAQWFPVVYLTLAGSVGAFVLFAWLINHWPVTRVSFIAVVNPLVALLLGWVFRDERLTLASLAGSGLVLLGLLFGLRGGRPGQDGDRSRSALRERCARWLRPREAAGAGRGGCPRRLDIPGEELGHVFHRPRDPAGFAGRRVVVVGGGESAAEAAIALAGSGAEVTLVHRGAMLTRPGFRTLSRLSDLLAGAPTEPFRKGRPRGAVPRRAPGPGTVTLRLVTRLVEVRPGEAVLDPAEGPLETVPADAVFILVGSDPAGGLPGLPEVRVPG